MKALLILLAVGTAITFAAAPPKPGASVMASARTPDPYGEVLLLNWRPVRGGFGAVLIANFDLKNLADRPVKDVEINCNVLSESGTLLNQISFTVYRRVLPNRTVAVRDLSAGFISQQTDTVTCKPGRYTTL
jgi:hypothetical protein